MGATWKPDPALSAEAKKRAAAEKAAKDAKKAADKKLKEKG